MEMFFLVILAVGLGAGAYFWGKASDPKKGGAMGCCHCGQCIASGECVLRKNLQKQPVKRETAS